MEVVEGRGRDWNSVELGRRTSERYWMLSIAIDFILRNEINCIELWQNSGGMFRASIDDLELHQATA
jgi:hypothetical protein